MEDRQIFSLALSTHSNFQLQVRIDSTTKFQLLSFPWPLLTYFQSQFGIHNSRYTHEVRKPRRNVWDTANQSLRAFFARQDYSERTVMLTVWIGMFWRDTTYLYINSNWVATKRSQSHWIMESALSAVKLLHFAIEYRNRWQYCRITPLMYFLPNRP